MFAIVLAASWGFICGVCERLILAPHRHFSSLGPAYFPAMSFSLFGGCLGIANPELILYTPLFLLASFLVGAAPALGTFHFSRWVLRTRLLPGPNGKNEGLTSRRTE